MSPESRNYWQKAVSNYDRWIEYTSTTVQAANKPWNKFLMPLFYKGDFLIVRQITASALNEKNNHPVISEWMMQLEQTVAEQQIILSDASKPKKMIEPFSAEQETLKALKRSLMDNRFLLAYCTGLARTIHKVKLPIEYDPSADLWFEVADYLCNAGILTTRKIDGTFVFVPAKGFTGRTVFNDAVRTYLRKRRRTFQFGKNTPLSIFVSLGLLYKPQANERYNSTDEIEKYCQGKRKKRSKINNSNESKK